MFDDDQYHPLFTMTSADSIPVLGFIHQNQVHLWDFNGNQVLLFDHTPFLREDKLIEAKMVPFEHYFNCDMSISSILNQEFPVTPSDLLLGNTEYLTKYMTTEPGSPKISYATLSIILSLILIFLIFIGSIGYIVHLKKSRTKSQQGNKLLRWFRLRKSRYGLGAKKLQKNTSSTKSLAKSIQQTVTLKTTASSSSVASKSNRVNQGSLRLSQVSSKKSKSCSQVDSNLSASTTNSDKDVNSSSSSVSILPSGILKATTTNSSGNSRINQGSLCLSQASSKNSNTSSISVGSITVVTGSKTNASSSSSSFSTSKSK